MYDKQIFLPLPQGQLAIALDHPQAEGIPIVALHGWLDNIASFYPLKQHFPQHPFWSIDLPGHGLSYHIRENRPYHFLDYLVPLQEAIERILPPKFILLGHSMGAALSLHLAALMPNRVEKVVLIDGIAPRFHNSDKAFDQLKTAISSLSYKPPRKKKKFIPNRETAIKLRSSVGSLPRETAEILISRQLRSHGEKRLSWTYDSKLTLPSLYRQNLEEITFIYREIQAPVLLLNSQSGYIERNDPKGLLLKSIKDLKSEIVLGGHHCHMTNTKKCAQLINEFLT